MWQNIKKYISVKEPIDGLLFQCYVIGSDGPSSSRARKILKFLREYSCSPHRGFDVLTRGRFGTYFLTVSLLTEFIAAVLKSLKSFRPETNASVKRGNFMELWTCEIVISDAANKLMQIGAMADNNLLLVAIPEDTLKSEPIYIPKKKA